MGILQKIFGGFRADSRPQIAPSVENKAAAADAEKAAPTPGTWDGGLRQYGYAWQNSPIDQILRDSAGLTPNVDPRQSLSACLLMHAVLPCFEGASAGFQALMGEPEIECEDERFKQIVEEMIWPKLYLHGEKIDRMTQTAGIVHIARAMLGKTFSYGMGFYILLDENQQIAADPKAKICGVRVCDPLRWDIQEYAPDVIQWTYQWGGQLYYINRDAIAGAVTLPSMRADNSAWNKPMAYVARYFAEFILKAVKGRGQTHVRKGAPVGITAISGEMPKEADPNDIAALSANMNTALAPIKAAYKEAINHANDTGRAADIVLTHGSPIKIESKTYGEGETWLTGFGDEFRTFYQVACASTKWPVYLLSPPESGGLNADNSKAQDNAAITASKEHQQAVAAELTNITRTCCLREGVRMPAKWSVKFNMGNFDNAKEVADINKTNAEAAKIWAETFTMVFNEGGASAAELFAEHFDLEWLEGVTIREPLEPMA